jgi:nickel/cobalt transporter (NicO) family protein
MHYCNYRQAAKLALPALAAVAFLVSSGYTHDNPFLKRGRDSAHTQAEGGKNRARPAGGRSFWTYMPYAEELLKIQRTLTARLSQHLRAIQQRPGAAPVAALVLLSFLYGIIHSLGPGHAKVLFISHSFSRPVSIRGIWGAGALFSVTHAGAAAAIFIIMRLFLGMGQAQSDLVSRKMLTMSGILVMVAGIIILASSYLEDTLESVAGRLLKKASGLWLVGFIAGLAPCPGAFLILTFSNIIGILPIGFIAVLAVSLGMALTVSTVTSIGSIMGQNVFRKNAKPGLLIAQRIVRYAGGGIIILIGALMAMH